MGRAYGEEAQTYAETIFKERLIHCAESLHVSVQEIGHHLERRANEHIVNFGLRDHFADLGDPGPLATGRDRRDRYGFMKLD